MGRCPGAGRVDPPHPDNEHREGAGGGARGELTPRNYSYAKLEIERTCALARYSVEISPQVFTLFDISSGRNVCRPINTVCLFYVIPGIDLWWCAFLI